MRKKGSGKKAAALVLTSALAVTSVPAIGPAKSVSAAGGTDESIVYAVDCGDINPATAPEDGPLGTHNSVTDQVYGVDSVTGKKWGIDDTVSGKLVNGACTVGGVSTDWTWPYEFTTSDQASKTSTNRYTKNQTESGIDPRHLDYRFEIENGTYFVEVGFADPWGVSQSPSVYANYGQEDQSVLAEKFLVSTNNGIVTAKVTVKNQELTINARGTGSENAAINMTHITIKKADDKTLAQTDYDALSIRTDKVASDLELPLTGSKADSKITWSSSNEAVITKDGKVTRPGNGEADAKVTLTAEIVNGTAKLIKEFEVIVSAMNQTTGIEYFDRTAVEVTDEYYDNALELDAKNLLALDADRLLAGFRETAAYAAGMNEADRKAYMKDKVRYGGGWENALIGGHTLGHYLTAVAQGVVNPGLSKEMQEKLKERLDYMVDALADCQSKTVGSKACKEGYLFGAKLVSTTELEAQFNNVEKSLANISTQAWVPWYTMHKILAGLVDAYEITGSKTALATAEKLGDWVAERANNWSDATQSKVLAIEYGGMNDAMYELYKCSAKEEYKKAAHMFDETALFEAVLSGKANVLNAKHANTTIPKFLGALCRYEVDSSETVYLEYAEAFWNMVIKNHTYITGGNSEDEHFGADNILHGERTNANNETCNTYNMLKLSRRLFIITGDKKYADYYENTLINAIMSSQNHETGLTMYFQPMASGYHKVFGTLDTNFWCCTGSGMENFTKLQDSIYFKSGKTVIVNQYLASKAAGDGYLLEQTGDLSESDTMTFKISGDKADISLKLRIPDWVPEGKAVVKFGEDTYEYTTTDGYIVIPKDKLAAGTSFTVKLPMEVVAYNLPDSQNTYAFKYGPFVLSAKLGTGSQSVGSHGVSVTVPTGKAVSNDSIGIRAEASVEEFMAKINQYLVRQDGSMDFTLNGTDFNYAFTAHYSQDKENYGIYWTYSVNEDDRGAEAVLAEKAEKRMQRILVDKIEQTGRGQYEERFLLADGETKDGLVDNNSLGEDAPDLTRRASAGGSFGYKMQAAEGEDNYVLVTYRKSEDGKPMKISVGDAVLFDGKVDSKAADVVNVNLSSADTADYYQVMYKIPADVVDKNLSSIEVLENNVKVTKRVLTVTFAGTQAEESARVCKSVSMLKAMGTENSLIDVTYNGKKLEAKENTYYINIPYTEVPEMTFQMADSNGYIEVDGKAIDETKPKKLNKASASGTVTSYTVKVYAEDFKTAKTYTIQVEKDYSGISLKENLVNAFNFEDNTNGATAVAKAATPVEQSGVSYQYQEGAVGKAITLDGTYGLKLMDNANALGESYTISFWMNPKNVGSGVDPTVAAGLFSPEYWLNLTLDGKIWSRNGDYIETGASSAYIANKWQHVTLTVDGNSEGTAPGTVIGQLYVDGEVVSKGNVAKGIMTQIGAKLYFGVNAWDAYFSGALDDVMVFNKVLSEEEIAGIASKAITSGNLSGGGSSSSAKPAVKSLAVKAAGYPLSKNTVTLVKGKKVKLKVNVSPAKADQKVTYSSNKKKVATVSSMGVVTAKGIGSAKIQVKAANGKKKIITIKVVKKAKINKVLKVKKAKISISKGKKALIAIRKMTAGTTSTVAYKSSAQDVAAVNAFGVITAKKKGKAVITVRCGRKIVKVRVTVK